MPKDDSDTMRSLGESFLDKGFFEINLLSGSMVWINKFVLSSMGYTESQMKNLTIFDLIPRELQGSVSSTISDTMGGKSHKYNIWPLKTADGFILWWYAVLEKDVNPIFWFKGEYLSKTQTQGTEYVNMCVTMNTINSHNDLSTKFEEHVNWATSEIDNLKETDRKVWLAIEDVKRISRGAHAAAEKAANAALENSKYVQDLRKEIGDGFSNQTTEILRLISTDVSHDVRFKSFEEKIEKAAGKAVEKATEAISTQTENAGTDIHLEATKAGKSLTRKISIPIGIITTIFGGIQILIQWYLKSKH
jgi:hypothetical protein